jgi:cysteinyl-tRNA synthetase
VDKLLAGARIEAGSEKEHPLDFALWKAAKPGEPYWESPWGKGRPGWHIECSTMALKYLGETLDIHGGGQDLIFPHHENEIAQSECFSGAIPFARYWLHNGLMQLGEEKMSKSGGNLITVKQALERFSPDAIRLLVLSSYYRNPLTYSEEALEAMKGGIERLRQAARWEGRGNGTAPIDVDSYRRRFIEAMEDDFNTPQALASLFDLAREINRARDGGFEVNQAQQMLLELANISGFTLEQRKVQLAVDPFIELLISVRDELRREKQFQLADRIRTTLGELGIALEDTPQGTGWKYRIL